MIIKIHLKSIFFFSLLVKAVLYFDYSGCPDSQLSSLHVIQGHSACEQVWSEDL